MRNCHLAGFLALRRRAQRARSVEPYPRSDKTPSFTPLLTQASESARYGPAAELSLSQAKPSPSRSRQG